MTWSMSETKLSERKKRFVSRATVYVSYNPKPTRLGELESRKTACHRVPTSGPSNLQLLNL